MMTEKYIDEANDAQIDSYVTYFSTFTEGSREVWTKLREGIRRNIENMSTDSLLSHISTLSHDGQLCPETQEAIVTQLKIRVHSYSPTQMCISFMILSHIDRDWMAANGEEHYLRLFKEFSLDDLNVVLNTINGSDLDFKDFIIFLFFEF